MTFSSVKVYDKDCPEEHETRYFGSLEYNILRLLPSGIKVWLKVSILFENLFIQSEIRNEIYDFYNFKKAAYDVFCK